ncbi:hypothetical protein GGI25_005404 [Coemansia spiralis]|uniref:Uncharacterized protein n=2 Tax=Coemansia TaxID=4863 RepID=A0A9W8G2P8_9FUNG|nr:hypothetical protein BX070DRAFT_248153 [Coemansia spiralis]KAJ1991212.1 hypothetical protein EDC05_003574 [Coemansia umbellata]KAJ2621182.1 hypothetical protein GGI26_004351 [Coemansia sp. RSA 1358]KAJ2671713.1 hypothetical protein GGI25_005404 [Coemansia spiralis]
MLSIDSNVPVGRYAFFKKELSQATTLVFSGDYDLFPEEFNSTKPMYRIDIEGRSLELFQYGSSSMRSILAGSYEGLTKSKALISGINGLSTVKRPGLLSSGWTVVYMNDRYKWELPAMSNALTLTDADNSVIAKFIMRAIRQARLGALYLYKNVDQEFLAIIMLTCKMVHATIPQSDSTFLTS